MMRLYQTVFNRDRYERTITAFKTVFSIGAGADDNIEVYHDKEYIYVYTENTRLEYVGLEVFERGTGEPCFDIFIDSGNSEDVDWLLNGSRTPSKIRFLCQWWG